MVAVKQKFTYQADGHLDTLAWIQKITAAHHLEETTLIQEAVSIAKTHCEGITTTYGQPCLEQGLEMAELLLDLKLDQAAVAAAILINTPDPAKEAISLSMGEEVTKLISLVQHMNALASNRQKSRDHIQIDRQRKIFLSMVSDIRVVLIKLAERICMMRGIKKINSLQRKRIAEETMDLYAPLANRLGIGQMKWELEDLAFHYTDPETYKFIATFLAERRTDREHRIHTIINSLQEEFDKINLTVKMNGRAKHIFSIFSKMKRKHLDLTKIYDYSAIRILVPTTDDCYTVLSIVHKLWEHIPEEYDDYINNPKPNGYRSIHTAVMGPDNKIFEIQIRTRDMHEESEHGIAAHWLYKENKKHLSGYEAKIKYLRQLLAWHKDISHKTTKDNINEDFIEDRIYILTPAGDIIDLPQLATPLDFAYHIHSEIGNHCRGAKINGHIVPLTHTLQTGDRVEIITHPKATPSRDWLSPTAGYLHTSRARAKVSHWFSQQDLNQYIDIGKNQLERELNRLHLPLPNLQKIAIALHYKNEDTLLATLGRGKIRTSHILHAIETHAEKMTHPTFHRPLAKKIQDAKHLEIEGISDLLIRVAKCCKPIPGDKIMGFITQGRGVSIHRNDCNNMIRMTKNQNHRLIPVNWDPKKTENYYADIKIIAANRTELLKEITALFSNAKIDLIKLNSVLSKKNNLLNIIVTIQIHERSELHSILQQLNSLPYVMEAKRISES